MRRNCHHRITLPGMARMFEYINGECRECIRRRWGQNFQFRMSRIYLRASCLNSTNVRLSRNFPRDYRPNANNDCRRYTCRSTQSNPLRGREGIGELIELYTKEYGNSHGTEHDLHNHMPGDAK